MHKSVCTLLLLVSCAAPVLAGDIWENLFREKLREAQAGDSAAQYDVGAMYQNGRGVTADRARAIEWYTRSAAQDNPQAVSRLELMQANAKRFERTRLRAAQGDIDSCYELGTMYGKGIGTAVDYRLARDWYGKAATAGHATASYNLGLMYHEGTGIPKDDTKAVRWFSTAAAGGSTAAQYYLGKLYASGSGVRRDYATALEWYRKAADGGFDQARGEIVAVRETMQRATTAKVATVATGQRSTPATGRQDRDRPPDTGPEPAPIPRPVLDAQPAGPAAGPHNVQLMEDLMLTAWADDTRPVSYLPSSINNCRTEDRKITCFSDDQTRRSDGNTVRFKTRAIISDFSGDDTFRVRYRNLVINATLNAANLPVATVSAYGDEGAGSGHAVNTGWGIEHTVDCRMTDRNTLICVKDNSITERITSQQSLAHGR